MNLNITNIRSDTRILNFWVENRILYLVVDAPHCQPGDPPEVVAEALLDWVPLGNAVSIGQALIDLANRRQTRGGTALND